MARYTEALLRTTAFLSPYKARLTAPLETLALEMSERLEAPIKNATDEEAITLLLEDDLAARPHYLKDEPVKVPDDAADEACTSLEKRGDLVERYGIAAVTAALKERGVGMGELKPPRQMEEGGNKQERKSDEPLSTTSPYSPNWKAPRAPTSEADREQQRKAAIASLFKTFGAKRSAEMARKYGKQIDGSPLRKVGAR
jgi:hypothetical protein